jgi:hypothetical protein
MGFGEFLDEGKSETAPAACSGAIVVETHETTPDQFPAAGGDPRPVVGDGDVRMTILAGKSHLDGAAGVLEGVVDEVGHHPGKLRLVARYHRVLDPPGAQLDPDRGGPPGAVDDHAGQVNGVAAGRGAAVEAREDEEIVDQMTEPAVTLGQLGNPCAVYGRLGMADRYFETGRKSSQGLSYSCAR